MTPEQAQARLMQKLERRVSEAGFRFISGLKTKLSVPASKRQIKVRASSRSSSRPRVFGGTGARFVAGPGVVFKADRAKGQKPSTLPRNIPPHMVSGRLKRSAKVVIVKGTTDVKAVCIVDAPYAAAVEKLHPFLKPTFEEQKQAIANRLTKEI